LANTPGLKEAKDSYAIENIITTHGDLYKSELTLKSIQNLEAKEVQNYIPALKRGLALVSEKEVLTAKVILEIQEKIGENKAGFRNLPGTALRNSSTGEIVYTPPQNFELNFLVKLLQQLRYLSKLNFDKCILFYSII
jgi:hypothetical protein